MYGAGDAVNAAARGPELVDEAAHRFGVTLRRAGRSADASSGADVRVVRTTSGTDAYLKVTPAARGSRALAAARRELDVYRHLSATLPVRTPALLDTLDGDDGVALLLGTAGSTRPAADWAPSDWTATGEALARLHSTPLPDDARWQREDPTLSALDAADHRVAEAFWGDRLDGFDRVLTAVEDLRAAACALGPAFVHGDCHTGNVLLDDDGPVFCDWQSAGIGRPAADLAFPAVRAAPSGTTVHSALVEGYRRERPCAPRTLRRAVLAEELLVLIVLWPEYAALNTPAAVAHVVRRARDLAAAWFDAEHDGRLAGTDHPDAPPPRS